MLGPPQNIRLESSQNLSQSTTVTLEWDGPNVGIPVDYYRVNVSPHPPSEVPSNVSDSSITLNLQYNVQYTVNVAAVNCIGSSNTTFSFNFGNYHCHNYYKLTLILFDLQ